MNEFTLRISSPDGEIFSGRALRLSLRGAEGDLAVMAGHVPFATTVKAGACRVLLPDGQEQSFELQSGILTVGHDGATLLTGGLRS